MNEEPKPCHLCHKPLQSGQSRTTLAWTDAAGELQVRTVHRKCKESVTRSDEQGEDEPINLELTEIGRKIINNEPLTDAEKNEFIASVKMPKPLEKQPRIKPNTFVGKPTQPDDLVETKVKFRLNQIYDLGSIGEGIDDEVEAKELITLIQGDTADKCPSCGGEPDNGFDRGNKAYDCTRCEPVEVGECRHGVPLDYNCNGCSDSGNDPRKPTNQPETDLVDAREWAEGEKEEREALVREIDEALERHDNEEIVIGVFKLLKRCRDLLDKS